MGLSALRKILAPTPFDPATLRGRAIAVDADNVIWSFVTAFGASGDLPRAPDGRSNAHLVGLANRLRLYASWGARSVWAFDGAQPALKEATLAARAARIEAARAAGDVAGGLEVTATDFAECRMLLDALGVPWIVAPGESDAQCAHLVRAGVAWAAVTQDWDIALHGAPRALRYLTGSRTRVPEILDLDAALAAAQLTRAELVDVAILVGTDYNEGIAGVGPVKAVKLVKAHGTLERALAAAGASLPEAATIRRLFLDHPVDAAFRPAFGRPDSAATTAFLVARGLSAERARKVADEVATVHASA